MRAFIASIAPPRMHDNFEERIYKGMDFSHAIPGIARFRCSAYSNLGMAGMAMRIVKGKIPTIEELNLPQSHQRYRAFATWADAGHRHHRHGQDHHAGGDDRSDQHQLRVKIITIEDPIEYLHTTKKALITQIEVGSDTPSFDQALRQALRQDPDVILVGELRDVETLRIALRAADTGHQVLSTVHCGQRAANDRAHHRDVPAGRAQAAAHAACGEPGGDHLAAAGHLPRCMRAARRCEILRGGPVPQKYILEGRALELARLHEASAGNGQQTFDQDLLAMFKKEQISVGEMLLHASNRESLQMTLRSMGAKGAGRDE